MVKFFQHSHFAIILFVSGCGGAGSRLDTFHGQTSHGDLSRTSSEGETIETRLSAETASTFASPEYQCSKLNAGSEVRPATYANPINLPYRFSIAGASFREAADPVIVLFKERYWLFASKSGGYWHSSDLINWSFVKITTLPIEDYAPTVSIVGNKLYYAAFRSDNYYANTPFETLAYYETETPEIDSWTRVGDHRWYGDPNMFLDDDGRMYLYHGIGINTPINVEELDLVNNLQTIGSSKVAFRPNSKTHGFEVSGDNNTGGLTFVEGAFMNKIEGKYFLQYAAPGTEYRSYADGVAVASSPTGPFTYQLSSPFSHKPTGFATGAGHGSTFKDKDGKFWHVATSTVSVRSPYERRLVLFPAGLAPDGALISNSILSDFPQYVPGVCEDPLGGNGTGWMLLSKGKRVSASSSKSKFKVSAAVDENIRTWWSASSGKSGEWLRIDLGAAARVEAVQVNFADEEADAHGEISDGYRYYIETSLDAKKWTMAIDYSKDGRNAPHDYTQLPAATEARYVRLTHISSPANAKFSVSDLRVFGISKQAKLSAPQKVSVVRNGSDRRVAKVSWQSVSGAEGYVVRFGTHSLRLTGNYQVYGTNSLDVRSLNSEAQYYFRVDALNGAGVTIGKTLVTVK